MLREKSARPRPRCIRRVLAIFCRAEIGKGVSGIRIGMEFVWFAETRHLGIEPPHICRRWIFIVFAEVAHYRAVNILRALERRRTIAPRRERIATVVHDPRSDIWTHRRHEIDDPSTHAE